MSGILIPHEEIRLKRKIAVRGWVRKPDTLHGRGAQTPFRIFTGLGDVHNRKVGSWNNFSYNQYAPGRRARHPVPIDDQGVPYQSGVDNYGIVSSIEPVLRFRTENIASLSFRRERMRANAERAANPT